MERAWSGARDAAWEHLIGRVRRWTRATPDTTSWRHEFGIYDDVPASIQRMSECADAPPRVAWRVLGAEAGPHIPPESRASRQRNTLARFRCLPVCQFDPPHRI